MKRRSARRSPRTGSKIRRSGFDALTPPRGVPAAVPFDHHHSHLPVHLVTATPVCRRYLLCLLRSDGRCGLTAFSLREPRPCGPGGRVGDGHGDDPGRLAFQERSDPGAGPGVGGPGSPGHRGRADDKQPPQIAVAHLRDMPEPILAPDEFCRSTRPSQAANGRPDLKAVGSGTLAAGAVAVMIPNSAQCARIAFRIMERCRIDRSWDRCSLSVGS